MLWSSPWSRTFTALAHIDEIAATPGIDVLFIGTSDLSFSLGLRGEQDHPKLDAAIAKIVAAGKKHGKILGRPGLTAAHIKKFQKQGFQFFQAPPTSNSWPAAPRNCSSRSANPSARFPASVCERGGTWAGRVVALRRPAPRAAAQRLDWRLPPPPKEFRPCTGRGRSATTLPSTVASLVNQVPLPALLKIHPIHPPGGADFIERLVGLDRREGGAVQQQVLHLVRIELLGYSRYNVRAICRPTSTTLQRRGR